MRKFDDKWCDNLNKQYLLHFNNGKYINFNKIEYQP